MGNENPQTLSPFISWNYSKNVSRETFLSGREEKSYTPGTSVAPDGVRSSKFFVQLESGAHGASLAELGAISWPWCKIIAHPQRLETPEGFSVPPYDPESEINMERAKSIVKKRRNTLRELAER